MPIYQYEARNTNGKLVKGSLEADNESIVGDQLLKQGITPIKISEAKEIIPLFSQFRDYFERRKVRGDDLSMFVRQMYVLTKTGVPITAGVRQLSDNARTQYMRNVLRGLANHLESGQDLAMSMQYYPDVFNPLMISMIRVGQNSGNLDLAFLQLNHYIDLEQGTGKRIKSSMRYPMFVLIAIFIAILIVDLFVIPTFAKLYAKANVALPTLTIVLMKFSAFILDNWIMMLVILIITIYSVRRWLKTPKGQFWFHEHLLKIPVIGNIFRRIILLRFAQTFAITTNAGIPIVEGLGLVEQAVDNRYAEKEIHEMRDALQRGTSLAKAAHSCDFFTPLELQMLGVGEETGELGPILEHIGQFYEREVEYDLKRLNDFIEPALTVGLAIIVLMLAFAVYLPIWNMVKLVQ